ncbi:RdgB/HAM1 family non-canonical purine NTP pyrophosphatase [Rhodobacter sp. KR11]|uniref:RdgB/HAM1 family non-canonical purine NTP pyrophosphatase n=1 Tax=Rhodobacter sp. KR11 TaxID=2974588 RepID=UPI0022218479|nr:RdgB/HAM1 family non-canonical purine NTP pyrophosphatase [Rhodobacter sp. KR11]MCW1918907.1 RdgB/HAM1 family non-canonical purine NTP pyrophosphatase [Rhodobacter sp. KR11]
MKIARGSQLLVATGNKGKLAEFQALLAPFEVEILGLKDFGLSEPEETERSFAGNALVKARAGAKGSGLVTLADDSGLEVAALGGAPGIYTADWAEGSGGRDFTRAMRKTWGMLEVVGGATSAAFCCTLAIVEPHGAEMVVAGRCEGRIVWPMRGSTGHGYDPIFQPVGHDRTFGEMADEEKNLISHRADAFRKLVAECFT